MEFVYNLTVVAHMLGLAALVGGYLVVATQRADAVAPNSVMVWGARIQLLTGLALVGIAEAALDSDLNHMKIGVKLVVSLAVAALVEISAGRTRRSQPGVGGLLHAAGVLAIINVAVASLWR